MVILSPKKEEALHPLEEKSDFYANILEFGLYLNLLCLLVSFLLYLKDVTDNLKKHKEYDDLQKEYLAHAPIYMKIIDGISVFVPYYYFIIFIHVIDASVRNKVKLVDAFYLELKRIVDKYKT